jgi:carbon-monoxide dehydrogenase medium subunit
VKSFDYKAPETVDETVSLLAEFGSDAKLLAGGQSLLVLMRQRLLAPGVVIALSHVADLGDIELNGSSSIGSMVRYKTLSQGAIGSALPLLARSAGSVGSVHIRNLGTVGGALAHCDPSGDVPTALMVLGAQYEALSSRGAKTYDSHDFSVGLFETQLAEDELLVRVAVPPQPEGASIGYQRFSYREGEYPMAVAACRLEWDSNGRCSAATVAVGGGDAFPKRLPGVEAGLVGFDFDSGDLESLLQDVARPDLYAAADIRGGAAWKEKVVMVTLGRALREGHALGQGRVDA